MQRASTVAALGTTQTLAWASSYYLPAMLASPMAESLHVSVPTVFAAFSGALMMSALLGPHAGHAIDRWGGRPVLMASNLVFAAGLVALALATGPITLFLAWSLIGVAMGGGLYEAAFSALVRLYGDGARSAITGITLIAGFASTLGWPLSTFLDVQLGWRGACLIWAALHLFIGLPLNARLPRGEPIGAIGFRTKTASDGGRAPPEAQKVTALLAFVFAATWFISTAMAAHLPRLLQASGASLTTAVAVGALVGPSQVAARLLEFSFLRRIHPLFSARLAALLHPLGVATLAIGGLPAAPIFGILHGAGNGILTIAKGTLPLVFFGPAGYGRRQGILNVPARIAQALAPWIFGLCIDRWGAAALALSAGIGLAAFAALLVMPKASPRVVDSQSVTYPGA